MAYTSYKFGHDRLILRALYMKNTVPSQLYLCDNSRDFPETPCPAVNPHCLQHLQVSRNPSEMKGTLHEERSTFSAVSL